MVPECTPKFLVNGFLVFPVTSPVTEIVLEPLVVLLKSRDPQVQRTASLAVSNFALNGPGKPTYHL